MTTIEMLEKALKQINNIGGVEASAVSSRDGLLICSPISKKQNADKLVAMAAAMVVAAETATRELGKGIPDSIIVESKNGRIIGTGAGPKALLLVMTRPDAGLGLVLIEMEKAAQQIREILG